VSEINYDLVIIGAGPGGYVAAIHAAQHGQKVALIEAREVGGACLQVGCIPTKAMLASVERVRQARSAGPMGVAMGQIEATLPPIAERRQKIVQGMTQGVRFLLEKNQVEVIRGWGALKSATEIEVSGEDGKPVRVIQQPRAILIATGSRPSELAVAPRDGRVVLNSNDLLGLTETPRELVVIGGGYIGCEFAGIFAPLGCSVTILEALDRLLPNVDKELGQVLERSFKKAGIKAQLKAQVAQVEVNGQARVKLAGGEELAGDKVLVAVGRSPNVERLGLEAAGVAYGRKGIAVNEFMQTNVPHIYAVGDVAGTVALAHVASAQGRLVVDNLSAESSNGGGSGSAVGAAAPEKRQMAYHAIPACVFTHPEIATVGLTEDEAAKQGVAVRVGRFPFVASGKAQAEGETEGFVKLVAEAGSGKLVGGHIIGDHAAELIAPITLAVRWGLTARQITQTVIAHPTLSEAILEAAEAICDRPTHIFVRR
jgi:dihydrolipoamide dehydrogenase